MVVIHKAEIASFSKRYLLLFLGGAVGWEAYHLISGTNQFTPLDALEAVAIYVSFSLAAICTVAFFRGWIEF